MPTPYSPRPRVYGWLLVAMIVMVGCYGTDALAVETVSGVMS